MEYAEEDVKEAMETTKHVWDSLAETVSNIINEIVRNVQIIIDNIVQKRENGHNYNWHVPLDTTKFSKVKIKVPKIPHIRNNI